MYFIEGYARNIYIYRGWTTIRHRSKGHVACLSWQLDYSYFVVLQPHVATDTEVFK